VRRVRLRHRRRRLRRRLLRLRWWQRRLTLRQRRLWLLHLRQINLAYARVVYLPVGLPYQQLEQARRDKQLAPAAGGRVPG